MSDSYEVTVGKLDSLNKSQTALYSEMSILNLTTINIVVIDPDDKRTTIPPSLTSLNENSIVIRMRSTINTTSSVRNTGDLIDGMTVKVPYYLFSNGPVYVKELDRVFCTEEQAMTAIHPYSKIKYTDGLSSCIEKMSSTINDAPMVKLVANDPTNTIDVLYAYMADEVVKIYPTHFKDDIFKLSIITLKDGKFKFDNTDISSLVSGTNNTIKFQNKIIPWITTSETNAIEMAKTFKWVTIDMLEDVTRDAENESKAKLDQAKADFNIKLTEFNTKLASLQSKLTHTEIERDEYKFKYNNYKADNVSNIDLLKQQYALRQLNTEYDTSIYNSQVAWYKANSAHQESQFKIWHLALAAALPVLGVLAIKLFDNSMKR